MEVDLATLLDDNAIAAGVRMYRFVGGPYDRQVLLVPDGEEVFVRIGDRPEVRYARQVRPDTADRCGIFLLDRLYNDAGATGARQTPLESNEV